MGLPYSDCGSQYMSGGSSIYQSDEQDEQDEDMDELNNQEANEYFNEED